MSFYKFTNNDLFVNQIKAHPSCKFDVYNSRVYYNNRSRMSGAFTGSLPGVPTGYINLYELNVDRNSSATGLAFAFVDKNSSLISFKTISTSDFNSLDYGTQTNAVSGAAYPLSASITREFFDEDHFSTMRINNSGAIEVDKDNHSLYGVTGVLLGLKWEGPNVTDEGLPNFKDDDQRTNETTNTEETSIVRYRKLRLTLSSSHINALQNTINHYSVMSPHFQYSASFPSGQQRNLNVVPVNFISVPSIFYGSSLQKGTIDLKYYITGTLIGQIQDQNKNGELIQIGPAGSTGSGSVAGIVLYKQGCVILTGSWDLASGPSATAKLDYKNTGTNLTSSWLYFAAGANDTIVEDGEGPGSRASASFAMQFSGTNETPVITMFAHASKGHLNYSNNPTYLTYSAAASDYNALTSSISYRESDFKTVNVVSSSFDSPTASFAKETYISKIGIYDKERNLIGVATVAKPVKKTEDREFTFKLKLDI